MDSLKHFFTQKKLFIILVFFLALLYCIYIFFLKALYYIDLDFGWQVRMGQWILANGIPQTDPLTYTMPSYPYLDHEWITSILFYWGATYLENITFSFVMVLLVFVAISLQITKRFTLWGCLPFLSSCVILLTFFGIRAQVIGWLFFSLLIKIIFSENLWKRWRLIVPLIILLWANMHGSFGMGLVALFVMNCYLIWRKKLTKIDVAIVVLSILATFINPYGYKVWVEVINHLVDTNAKDRIGEWMPLLYSISHSTLFYLFYIIVSFLFIVAWRTKIELYKIVLLTVMLFAAFSSIRHIPFYILVSLPLLIDAFFFTSKKFSNKKKIFTRSFMVIFYLIIFICLVELVYVDNFVQIIHEEKVYPSAAIHYLRLHPPENQIMSVWEWGGYLTWKLPEKKVFIDGRTLVWNHDKQIDNESTNIYKENELILWGKIPLRTTVKKYNIDTLLFPLYIAQIPIMKKQIIEDGWIVKYQDSVSVIYQKKPSHEAQVVRF